MTLIPNIAPGDPARKIAGGTASPERLMQVTESLGLRDSVATQLSNLSVSVVTLDFGESFSVATGEPVMSLVWKAVANSAKLVILSLLVIVPVSILGGLVADQIIHCPDFDWRCILILSQAKQQSFAIFAQVQGM